MSRPISYVSVFAAATLAGLLGGTAHVFSTSASTGPFAAPEDEPLIPAEAKILGYNCLEKDPREGQATCVTEYTTTADPATIHLVWDGAGAALSYSRSVVEVLPTTIAADGRIPGAFRQTFHAARGPATADSAFARFTPASDQNTTCELAGDMTRRGTLLICHKNTPGA